MSRCCTLIRSDDILRGAVMPYSSFCVVRDMADSTIWPIICWWARSCASLCLVLALHTLFPSWCSTYKITRRAISQSLWLKLRADRRSVTCSIQYNCNNLRYDSRGNAAKGAWDYHATLWVANQNIFLVRTFRVFFCKTTFDIGDTGWSSKQVGIILWFLRGLNLMLYGWHLLTCTG